MKNIFRKIISLVLAIIMIIPAVLNTAVLAENTSSSPAEILSTGMSIEAAKSNMQKFYANDDWKKIYPDGLFLFEYSTYEISEGGTDINNPEDVYLGIVVYRIGGTTSGSTLTYMMSCSVGDSEMYPSSKGYVTFAPGATTATIKVKIKNDNKRNGDQLLMLSLIEATVGYVSDTGIAAIKIFDDEPYVSSVISISASSAITDACEGKVDITVKRKENSVDIVSLRVRTEDGSAEDGKHYNKKEYEIVFLAGQTEQTVSIPLIQSGEVYTTPKYFTVVAENLKGCVLENDSSLKINITNKKEDPSKELTNVDGNKAELEQDTSDSLAGSSSSVININDNVDRKELLKAVIGSGSGITSLLGAPETVYQTDEIGGEWSSTLTIPITDFEERYCTDGNWRNDGSIFSNGNEDLLIVTKTVYNLNYYEAVTIKVQNQAGSAIMGKPNTAFGYLAAGGPSDNHETFKFVKDDLRSPSESSLSFMRSNKMYYFVNHNNENINYMSASNVFSFESNASSRYEGTHGIGSDKMRLFFTAYDDEGWDDTNFKIGETTLHRAVLPFYLFENFCDDPSTIKYDPKNADKTIEFVQEGYTWSIGVDTEKGGGIALLSAAHDTDPISHKYGFYIGSNLKISFKPVEANANLPIPEYVYLCDDKGNIHNSSMLCDDGMFYISLETILTNNITSLVNEYYMTDLEAKNHVQKTIGGREYITSVFDSLFKFRVSYNLKKGTVISFKNIYDLSKPSGTESEESHKSRIYNSVFDIVTFFKNDEKIQPDYEINLNNSTISFEDTEFDYIQVTPKTELGYLVSSNLYDKDYQNFDTSTKVPNDVCNQIKGNVIFTVYDSNATYLEPQINIQSTYVSEKTKNGFEAVYVADDIDDFIPFEALYGDTSKTPAIQYYTVRFSVSDIYAGSMSGEVKDFNINVNYSDLRTSETYKLFSFTFKGGASFAEASDVELKSASTKFKTNEGTDYESFMPIVELVDYVTQYEYIMYIPTYYNYSSSEGNDPLAEYYTQIFKGADGFGIEMNNFSKQIQGDTEETPEIIYSLDVSETKSVMDPLPAVSLNADEQKVDSYYFEEQDEFYTYNRHQLSMRGYKIGLDTSGFFVSLSKILKIAGKDKASGKVRHAAGTSVYVTVGDEQIVCGFKLGATGYGDQLVKKNDSATDGTSGGGTTTDTPNNTTGKESVAGGNKGNTTGGNNNASAGGANVSGMAANGAQQTGMKEKLSQLNSSSAVTGFLSFDAKITFTYNKLTHSYVISAFSFTFAGGVGVTSIVPLTPAPFIYFTFSTKVAASVSLGASVIQEYIDDQGKIHYAVSFNGITLAPSLSISLGVGIGASGLLSYEILGTADVNASITLFKEKYNPPQMEFDLDSTLSNDEHPAYVLTSMGQWKTYKSGTVSNADGTVTPTQMESMYNYCYGASLLQSDTVDDKLVLTTKAASFQLVAATDPKGGIALITVKKVTGEILEEREVNLYSSERTLYKTVFNWETKDFDYDKTEAIPVIIEIKNVSSSAFGKTKVILDSIRIHNLDFKVSEYSIPSISSFSFKLAVQVKPTVVGFSFPLDVGYMLIKYTGVRQEDENEETSVKKTWTLTLGSFHHTKTYVLNSLRTISADEDIPVIMATASRKSSNTNSDYFNTGEFASTKTKTLLMGDIDNTALTQVIEYNGSIYTFYTVTLTGDDGETSFYQLYVSKDGETLGAVCNDSFVADFTAFINGDGKLSVIMSASDSTVKSITRNSDGTATLTASDGTTTKITSTKYLKNILERTCVKLATFDEVNNTFDVSVYKKTDGNGLQESLPTASSFNGGSTVAFFVEDAKTENEAKYDLNWTGYNDKSASTSQIMTDLFNSMYSGKAEIHCCFKASDGTFVDQTVPMDSSLIEKGYEKAGFKITSIDSIMVDENTVLLAYSVELPYAQKSGFVGTLKEIHYKKGVFNATRTAVEFADTVVVDSLFDYNDYLDVVETSLGTLSDRYYNKMTGEYNENIIMNNVQFENVALCTDDDEISDVGVKPCLFYKTNNSINYVTYEEIEEKSAVGMLYDGAMETYVLLVGLDGNIYIIYNDVTSTSSYTDTLYIAEYNTLDKFWNHPRRLTYTDVFDEEKLKNHQPTASVVFDNLSAVVDSNGKVAVAFKSSYVPFSYDGTADASSLNTVESSILDLYDKITVDEEGNVKAGITVPVPDYESEYARTDMFMITYEDMVTKIEVEDLVLSNKLFLAGEEIEVGFTIDNIGDRAVEDIIVQLCYYDLDTNSRSVIASQNLSGFLLAGDEYKVKMSYVVGPNIISDNTLLTVRILNSTKRRVLYDSYEECYLKYISGEWENSNDDDGMEGEGPDSLVFHKIDNHSELTFGAIDVDIDNEGIMNYTVNVLNRGTLDVEEDVTLICNAYSKNEETMEYTYTNTIFSVSIDKERLTAGGYTAISDSFKVNDYLHKVSDVNTEFYYNFEIISADAQYDTLNDSTDINVCQQIPKVEIESITSLRSLGINTDGRLVTDMKLGDEIVIKNDILSEYISNDRLRCYEVNSDVLSIDASSNDGTVRVKATGLPNGKEGYAKLLLNIKDTVISRYLYIYISNAEKLNFTESMSNGNWKISTPSYVYAMNYDLMKTENDGSEMNFGFVGKDLKIYGDFLSNGGCFKVIIRDSAGKTVSEDLVSTKAEKYNCGMLLYNSAELPFGSYSVTVKSVLENGEALALDCAEFTIDTSDADTTPYNVVEQAYEVLDAPLLSGRNREARFTLNFSKNICIAENTKLSDITVKFDEYEKIDGEYSKTGKEVIFTASEINGKSLTFSGVLMSEPSRVLKYVLKSNSIASGSVITEKNGVPVKTTIPNYASVSYTLRESGILSAIVADDFAMPNGSIKKSVRVKFATAPNVNRITGTKLLYKTTDENGAEREVDFFFAEMTEDPRIAIYRAEKLELSENELSKYFAFEKGILLNESNYVLITSDGDYLENDLITVLEDKSDLDIYYEKIKNNEKPRIILEEGSIPAVYVGYKERVDASSVINSKNAYVTVEEKRENGSALHKLILSEVQDGKILVFKGSEAISMSKGESFELSLVSKEIMYSDKKSTVVCEKDGIAVNPKILDADVVYVNDFAYLSDVSLYFKDGAKRNNTKLCATVGFNVEVDESTLKGSSLSASQTILKYDGSFTETVELQFVSAERVASENSSYTLAYYELDADVSLCENEISKTYNAQKFILPEGKQVVSKDNVLCSTSILNWNVLTMSREAASKTSLELINSENGLFVQMTLLFDREIQVLNKENVFAFVDMETNGNVERLELSLEKANRQSLIFRSKKSISVVGGQVSSLTVAERISDMFNSVTTNNQIGISELVPESQLIVDMSKKGSVENAWFTITSDKSNTFDISVNVAYSEKLNKVTFEKSSVEILMYVEYENGSTTTVETSLEFENVENDTVAIYKGVVTAPEDATVVQFTLNGSVKSFGNNYLYNDNTTLILNGDLPEVTSKALEKVGINVVAVISKKADKTIDRISDSIIAVTYSKDINVTNLEGISLTANVNGIANVDEIVYKAVSLYNGNTVIFATEDKDYEYGEKVEILIKDRSVALEGESEIFGKNGMKANTLLPEISRSFDVTKEASSDSEDTESSEDSSENQGGTASPGDNTAGFITIMAILALASVLAVVRLKKVN